MLGFCRYQFISKFGCNIKKNNFSVTVPVGHFNISEQILSRRKIKHLQVLDVVFDTTTTTFFYNWISCWPSFPRRCFLSWIGKSRRRRGGWLACGPLGRGGRRASRQTCNLPISEMAGQYTTHEARLFMRKHSKCEETALLFKLNITYTVFNF